MTPTPPSHSSPDGDAAASGVSDPEGSGAATGLVPVGKGLMLLAMGHPFFADSTLPLFAGAVMAPSPPPSSSLAAASAAAPSSQTPPPGVSSPPPAAGGEGGGKSGKGAARASGASGASGDVAKTSAPLHSGGSPVVSEEEIASLYVAFEAAPVYKRRDSIWCLQLNLCACNLHVPTVWDLPGTRRSSALETWRWRARP